MTATNVNICADGGLEARAQSVLANFGLDVPTAFNIFLTQVVDRGTLPFEISETKATQKMRPHSDIFDCMEIWTADDFDEPLEEMREYME